MSIRSENGSITTPLDIISEYGVIAGNDIRCGGWISAIEQITAGRNICAKGIRAGKCISAGGDIVSGGSIEADGFTPDAHITAGGNLIANADITCFRGPIFAGWFISAGLSINAGGDLTAGKGIGHREIKAARTITHLALFPPAPSDVVEE